MRINHNIPALNAHRQLNRNSNVSAGVLERLSSGKRINRAADDAAGMAISEKMKAQVRGLTKAAQNTLDGISLIQTAEGAMNEVHSMLQRMRELAVQSANGTVTDEDRKAIQDEINQLTSEVNRIANGTEFNTRNILRGNEGPNSNTIVHRMSTGEAAILNTGAEARVNKAAVWETGALTPPPANADGEDTFTFNGFAITLKYDNEAAAGSSTLTYIGAGVGTVTLGTKDTAPTSEQVATAIKLALDAYTGPELTGFTISDEGANGIKFEGEEIDGAKNNHLIISGTIRMANNGRVTDPGVTEKSAGFPLDKDVSALGNLTSQQLSIWIDGKERVVNLNKLDGTDKNSTRNNLLEAINKALGDLGEAVWNKDHQIEIKSTSIGGSSEIKVTGTDIVLDGIFGSSSLRATGVAEKDLSKANGSFYFRELPEIGSTLTIGNEKIEFYNSSVEPYTGSNRPIDLNGINNTETLVSMLADLGIDGVDLKVDTNVKERLVITAKEDGFKGQAVFVEGTPNEFTTNLQVGPNQGQGFRLIIGDIRATKLGISSSTPDGNSGVKGSAFRSNIEVTDGLSASTIEYALDVSTEERATAAITVYDNAILKVAEMRGSLGAIQNRLEYTAANLENTTENLTAALSRIEDADMALEMSEFTKYNILIQAGTAMLAQANQRPQTILQLLGN